MTNPTRFSTVLCDGTKPNYQTCVVEVSSAAMIPGGLVIRNSTHSKNGVILSTAEGPLFNTNAFDIGIIEVTETAIYTTEKYDWTTQIPDNDGCKVHWLKPGDIVLANMTNPAATLAIGSQMESGAGVLVKPTVVAFSRVSHLFTVERTVVTGDTVAKVKYVGFGPLDAT
jgi:hypothetical protein